MSASKARMQADIHQLRAEADQAHRLAIALLERLVRLGEEDPQHRNLLDGLTIPEYYWRHVC